MSLLSLGLLFGSRGTELRCVWISQKSRRLSSLGMRKRYVDTLLICCCCCAALSESACRCWCSMCEGSSIAHTSRSRGCDCDSLDQRKPASIWYGSRNVNVGLRPNSGVGRGFLPHASVSWAIRSFMGMWKSTHSVDLALASFPVP